MLMRVNTDGRKPTEYEAVTQALSAKRKVIAVELEGHGGTVTRIEVGPVGFAGEPCAQASNAFVTPFLVLLARALSVIQ